MCPHTTPRQTGERSWESGEPESHTRGGKTMLQIFGTSSSCLGSRQEDGAPGESAWKRTGSIFKPPLSWLLIVCLFNTGGVKYLQASESS